MGGWFSQSILSDFDDLETRLDAILSGSGAKNVLLRSVSFGNYGRGGSPGSKKILSRSYGSAKMISRGLQSKEAVTLLSSDMAVNERHEAAVKLQKVYKSFRTRRRLADCAVMVEQRWWKLLDFAELKRSSVSFFDIDRPETAVSRWSRARTRAAKVGKGLSKDEKARKLALQHWLEAIDPRHRYGHNLQFYYVKWLHCESKQPFFYWLDIGEGKEVNLEKCPRSKLQQQCIKYLGPTERKAYEVALERGKFSYKESGEVIDTREGPRDTKWIFVLSTSKALYVGTKSKGTFQHSSFLAGGATLSAGRLEVEDGILKAVWPHSGHYLPTEENFEEFMTFLEEHNVDLTNVKKSPGEEDEIGYKKSQNASTRSDNISKEYNQNPRKQNSDLRSQDDMPKPDLNPSPVNSRFTIVFHSKIAKLEIPDKRQDDYEKLLAEEEEDFMVSKLNLFGDDNVDEGDDEKPVVVPKDKIMKRIDSHKGTGSYQLARQLSTRWSTGAGPRIGCMRDYPSELQFQVLKQANLSPRPKGVTSSPRNSSRLSQRVSLGKNGLENEISSPKLAK